MKPKCIHLTLFTLLLVSTVSSFAMDYSQTYNRCRVQTVRGEIDTRGEGYLALYRPSWSDVFYKDYFFVSDVVGSFIQRDKNGSVQVKTIVLFEGGRTESKNDGLEPAVAALEVLQAKGICR